MSKIIVIGDIHFGMRRNSKTFHEILMRSLDKVFKTVKKEDSVVVLGDVFDSRSNVDFKILNDAWDFFIKLSRSCKELFVLAGNHDEYYKEFSRENTNCRFLEFEPGSDSKIAPVKVVTELSVIEVAGYNCLFVPWIDTVEKKNAAKSKLDGSIGILFGHFDSVGLYKNTDPLSMPLAFTVEDLKDVPLVLSGHYHKRLANGNIIYVGSYINSTFNDLDDVKGLHTIRKENLVEFIPNGCPTFHYLNIDDPALFIQAVNIADETTKESLRKKIEGNFIKIFLQEYRKENDDVYKIIKSLNPLEVFVSFNRADFTDDTPIDFEGFDSKTDVASFLLQYIDNNVKEKLPPEITLDNIKELINRKSLEFKQIAV